VQLSDRIADLAPYGGFGLEARIHVKTKPASAISLKPPPRTSVLQPLTATYRSPALQAVTDSQLMEIVAHVALNLFTNYVNVAFAVPVDFPAVALRR